MSFNEANTVEAFIRDRLAGLGWRFIGPTDLPRQPQEALVETYLRDALIRLNPEIAANPSRVDDVLYRLRAIVTSVRSDGLVKANEEFAAWALGERSMPFGPNGEHVTIRLIDFDNIEQNGFVVTQQFTLSTSTTSSRTASSLLSSSPFAPVRLKSAPICSCSSTACRLS